MTLVGADSSGEHPWIETRRVNERTTWHVACGRLDAKSLHHIAGALCWLHGQGFAHGSFSGEHVILGRSGQRNVVFAGPVDTSGRPRRHFRGQRCVRSVDCRSWPTVVKQAGLARIGSQFALRTRDLWETALALELLAAQPSPPPNAAGQGPPQDRRRRLAGIALATTAAALLPMGLLAIREGEPTSASCPASDGPTSSAIAGSDCPAALSIDREGRVHVGNRVYTLNLQRSTVRITNHDCDGSAELEVAGENGHLTAVFAQWPATDLPVSASLRTAPFRQDTPCDSSNE